MTKDNYKTCQGCGIVIDFDAYCLEREDRMNHDGDMKCEQVQCPVCKTWMPDEKWVEVS